MQECLFMSLARFTPFTAENCPLATSSPTLLTAAVGDALVRTRLQHLVMVLPQPHFNLPWILLDKVMLQNPVYISTCNVVTSSEAKLALETLRNVMKRETCTGSTHKAEQALYYKWVDLHHCQKQRAECPITSILTPKFHFPASDLVKGQNDTMTKLPWDAREIIHHYRKIRPTKSLPETGELPIDWQIILSIDGCTVTHIGRCDLSCLHTLMGSKLTVTTQHLHHIVDGSVKAPA